MFIIHFDLRNKNKLIQKLKKLFDLIFTAIKCVFKGHCCMNVRIRNI